MQKGGIHKPETIFEPLPNVMLLVALIVLIYFTFMLFYEAVSFSWGFTFVLLSIIVIAASFLSISPVTHEY